jgi:hypothetical protein
LRIAAGAATETIAASPLARRPGRPLPLYQLGPFAPRIVASRDNSRDYGHRVGGESVDPAAFAEQGDGVTDVAEVALQQGAIHHARSLAARR